MSNAHQDNPIPDRVDLRDRNERLTHQLIHLMDVHARLEIADLEHSLYFSNQKRLMDFVQRITLRLDDDDLMDVMVEEFLIELRADRVSFILVGNGPVRTLAVTQEAVEKGIKRLSLPYFISPRPSDAFARFLFKCLEQNHLAQSDWNAAVDIHPDYQFQSPMDEEFHAALEGEFDLARKVNCGVAMAFPIETTLGGTSILCVQRSKLDQEWSKLQKDLFMEMCRYAGTVLEQTQLTQHIRDLKDQLSSLIESMPSAIIVMDLLGAITSWNGKALEFFDLSEEDAVGRIFWEIVPEYRFLSHTLRDIMRVESSSGLEFDTQPFKRKDGSLVYHRANLFTMFKSNRGEVALRIDDVTKTMELNHQLFHSQKMETVGTLAGGLAHDFNNVLGGIVGTASLMKERLQNGNLELSEFMDDLEVIESCTTRATTMVKRLLALSRKSDIVMEPVDFNVHVRNVVALCEASFESRIQIIAKFSVENIWILADQSQLEQAILNICVNARDAMKSGGALTLTIGKFIVTDTFRIRHTSCSVAELAKLSIRDTGEGIPLEYLDKIFDPFFSTKAENGTGLGLSIVDNIMKQHKGFYEVTSSPRSGTTFHLYFHLSDKAPIIPSREILALKKGQGEILVVDDDEMVRKTAARILEELGYTVATVANGASAIAMLEGRLNFDLILLDVDMPVMNGLDTAKVLRNIRSGMKILFCTGRQHQYEMDKVLSQENTWLMDKPFDMQKMANMVRVALDGHS